jgi:hypothetical protein
MLLQVFDESSAHRVDHTLGGACRTAAVHDEQRVVERDLYKARAEAREVE